MNPEKFPPSPEYRSSPRSPRSSSALSYLRRFAPDRKTPAKIAAHSPGNTPTHSPHPESTPPSPSATPSTAPQSTLPAGTNPPPPHPHSSGCTRIPPGPTNNGRERIRPSRDPAAAISTANTAPPHFADSPLNPAKIQCSASDPALPRPSRTI